MRLRVAVRECDGFGRSKLDQLTPHIILKVDGDIIEVEPRRRDHYFTSRDHTVLYNPRPQFIECDVYNDSTLQEHLGTGQVYIRGILPNLATGGNIVVHPVADYNKRNEIAGCVLVLMKLEMPKEEEEDWRESVRALYTSDELGFGMEPPSRIVVNNNEPPDEAPLSRIVDKSDPIKKVRHSAADHYCDWSSWGAAADLRYDECSLTPPRKRRAAAEGRYSTHTGSCRPSIFPV